MQPLRLHILSDVHLEFGNWSRPRLRDIDCDVHILAGDIGVGLQGLDWALKSCDRPTIYVMGNHEFYGQRTVEALWDKARAKVAGTPVHLLENEAVVIDGVRFLGATLWTDFGLNGALHQDAMMRNIGELMTDYARIRIGRRPSERVYARPCTTLAWHERSAAFLDAALPTEHAESDKTEAGRKLGPTVVVTHHAPLAQSLLKEPPYDITDTAYASCLDDLVVRADLWVHGHTHVRVDYTVKDACGHKTRVVSNPRGYVGVEPVAAFDPKWVIEVGR